MIIKRFKYIADSIPGVKRQENQDNFLAVETLNFNLYFLFDGVGGALNGKKATQLAKKFINSKYNRYFDNTSYDLKTLMYDTNKYLLNANFPDLKSTFCALCTINSTNQFMYSSLGDSRIYLITPQFMEPITIDDKPYASTNLITKCLGMEGLSYEDFYSKSMPLSEDEKILLCSDGFYSVMENKMAQFYEVFISRSLFTIKKKLKSLIKDNNFDDSTYMLIK